MLTLQMNRQRIEKAVYSNGINVALYNAERADQYERFKRKCYQGLNKQVDSIAKKKDRLEMLILLAKKQKAELKKYNWDDLNQQLLTAVGHELKASIGDYVNVQAFMYWAGTQGGQAALDKLNIQGIFNLVNPQTLAYFDDQSNLLINSVDDFTKKWIALKIQTAIETGQSLNDLSSEMEDDSRDISKLRAENISITETAKAMSHVERMADQRLGIEVLIWRTSVDDRVDEICIGLEGTKSDIRGNFPGGYAGPPAHPRCRCFLEAEIPDDWFIPENPWLGQ